MQSDIQYIKNDKAYKVKKQAWRPRKVRLWLILPLLILLAVGGYGLLSAIGIETTGVIEYEVEGDIDYRVYLKDNGYYSEKFLDQGMQYIANLINVVRADFEYKLKVDAPVDAQYKYEIIANAKATDRSDKSKILYENAEVLIAGTLERVHAGEVNIQQSVDVDYGKYNDLMRSFRQDYGISANCFLDLKMVVNLDGEIKTEDTLAMNIPLSDQTLDITMDAQAINRSEQIGKEKKEIYVQNLPLLIVGSVIMVVCLALIVVLIYYYATRYNDNLYEKALHKILKEYDTYIVNATETIYELPSAIRVEGFKELLDAAQAENAPVVFLEVIPGEKAYFVVNGVTTTYRYTLSKAYQDKLAAAGEREY